jgi:hypothetical protein
MKPSARLDWPNPQRPERPRDSVLQMFYAETSGESKAVYKSTVKPSVPRKPGSSSSMVSNMAARFNNSIGHMNTESQ